MNFNEAIENFQMIQRIGWNGKGLFVFQQVPSEIPIEVVPKMQSLPEAVKDEFIRRYDLASDNGNKMMQNNNPLLTIRYNNQLAIVDKEININGLAPSVIDALADDWIEYIPE